MDSVKKLTEKIWNGISGLPGMKLIRLAAKELRLIKNQKISIAIVILYPLVIIGSLGLAFGGTTTLESINVPVYLHSDVGDLDVNEFLTNLEDTGRVNIILVDSPDEITEMIFEKKAKIGINVYGQKTKYDRISVNLVYDNSDVVTSEFFLGLTKRALRDVAFEKSKEVITEMWADFADIIDDLDEELEKIESYAVDLDETERDILDLNRDIGEIDIQGMKDILFDQKSNVSQINEKLDSFDSDISSFRNSIDGMEDSVTGARAQLDSYRSLSHETIIDLVDYKENLEAINESSGGSMSSQLGPAISDIGGAIRKLERVNSDIDATRERLTEAEGEVSSLSNRLTDSEESIAEVKETLGGAFTDLNKVEVEVGKLERTIVNLQILVDDGLESKKVITEDLNIAKEKIGSFLETLDDLRKYNPEFLANPISVSTTPLFTSEKLALMTPFAIAFMLMLTAILMTAVGFVSEIREGAYLRFIISSSRKITIFGGKILGQIIFGLIEAGLILLIAIALFGIKINLEIVSVLIALIAILFCFIGIGIFLINFTQKQSTVILTALLVMLPMVFLSGVVLPIDLVNPSVQVFAKALPLALSMELLTDILIKGNSIVNETSIILQLVVPSIFLIGFTIRNKKIK